MELIAPGDPLRAADRPRPDPGPGEVLIKVHACAVCRTDLHVVDGDLPDPKPHVVPGHEVVGTVETLGSGVTELETGQRVGVPWLGWTCGECRYCRDGQENLCPDARFNGYTLDGGYGEYLVADARYCFPIPDFYSDEEAAPLLCAGLIGYRCLRMAGEGRRLGLYGFGAAAHILIQVSLWQGREIYGFVRPGDDAAREFAFSLGAKWAGDSTEAPPEELDAAILFAPVGDLVPRALKAVRPGGTVVCGGIHMSDIPCFPYDILWREKKIVSVANLTRQDALEFLELAPKVPVRSSVRTYPLDDANMALSDLRNGRLQGAAVLLP
ncbi:zinc-dependent alcohol dehydrogenase family protein [Nisaea acidiphila]|uniref:alcohol dehydrogenase n=2 Tax=Nisaea acidiphila TaxID=1862145 RepID=A0A9J7B3L9_9PROT|nr:zinc-dependent alcohol dehydrogenase family protein [Nisaea acidiphila]UUX52221.1 zinc-dependent alcohol dehydrogenase family protein [Nisaea acidiphila]